MIKNDKTLLNMNYKMLRNQFCVCQKIGMQNFNGLLIKFKLYQLKLECKLKTNFSYTNLHMHKNIFFKLVHFSSLIIQNITI